MQRHWIVSRKFSLKVYLQDIVFLSAHAPKISLGGIKPFPIVPGLCARMCLTRNRMLVGSYSGGNLCALLKADRCTALCK